MTLVAGAVLLLILVFVHELGHFLVAKLTGVRVLTFSLGFGPRLFGVKVGDTDYRVSLFPLGGYVRMYGDDIHEEVPPEEKHRSFLDKPVPAKAAIAFAGPAANFLLPIAVFFFAVVGTETVPAAKVGNVLEDGPAARAGMLVDDRIVEAEGQPIEKFKDLIDVVRPRPGEELELVVERKAGPEAEPERVTLQIVPRGVKSANPLEKGEVFGQIGITPNVPLPALDVVPGSAADEAGLSPGDVVVSAFGQPVPDARDLFALLDARSDEPWPLEVRSQPAAGEGQPEARSVTVPVPERPVALKPAGEAARYAVTRDELVPDFARTVSRTRAVLQDEARELERRRGLGLFEGTVAKVQEDSAAAGMGLTAGDRVLAIDGKPLRFAPALQTALNEDPGGPHVLGVLRGDAVELMVFRQGFSQRRGLEDLRVLGAEIGSAYGGAETFDREVSVGEALVRATKATGQLIVDTAKGLWMLVTFQVSLSSLGGPITIFNLAGQAMDHGLERFVYFLCLISVNLGLINLLPVPVLDGGHLLLFGIEAVRRKELDLATKERALKIGLSMLVALMGLAIFNDLIQLVT